MSVLVSDQDRGGDVLARIAPSKTVKLSEYSKLDVDGVWRIADSRSSAAIPGRTATATTRRISLFLNPARHLPRSELSLFQKWHYSPHHRRLREAVAMPRRRQPSSHKAHQAHPPVAPSPPLKSEHDFNPHCRRNGICPGAVQRPLKTCSLFRGGRAALAGRQRAGPQADRGFVCSNGIRAQAHRTPRSARCRASCSHPRKDAHVSRD